MKSEAVMLINTVKVRVKGCSFWCQVDHNFAHERKGKEACEVIVGVLISHQTAWSQGYFTSDIWSTELYIINLMGLF